MMGLCVWCFIIVSIGFHRYKNEDLKNGDWSWFYVILSDMFSDHGSIINGDFRGDNMNHGDFPWEFLRGILGLPVG